MATLMIDGVNEQITARYETASDAEKQQIKQVIEDIFRLLSWRQNVVSEHEDLRRKAIAFARQHRTFPLDWSHNKLSREELNER
jgi:ribosomal protein L23